MKNKLLVVSAISAAFAMFGSDVEGMFRKAKAAANRQATRSETTPLTNLITGEGDKEGKDSQSHSNNSETSVPVSVGDKDELINLANNAFGKIGYGDGFTTKTAADRLLENKDSSEKKLIRSESREALGSYLKVNEKDPQKQQQYVKDFLKNTNPSTGEAVTSFRSLYAANVQKDGLVASSVQNDVQNEKITVGSTQIFVTPEQSAAFGNKKEIEAAQEEVRQLTEKVNLTTQEKQSLEKQKDDLNKELVEAKEKLNQANAAALIRIQELQKQVTSEQEKQRNASEQALQEINKLKQDITTEQGNSRQAQGQALKEINRLNSALDAMEAFNQALNDLTQSGTKFKISLNPKFIDCMLGLGYVEIKKGTEPVSYTWTKKGIDEAGALGVEVAGAVKGADVDLDGEFKLKDGVYPTDAVADANGVLAQLDDVTLESVQVGADPKTDLNVQKLIAAGYAEENGGKIKFTNTAQSDLTKYHYNSKAITQNDEVEPNKAFTLAEPLVKKADAELALVNEKAKTAVANETIYKAAVDKSIADLTGGNIVEIQIAANEGAMGEFEKGLLANSYVVWKDNNDHAQGFKVEKKGADNGLSNFKIDRGAKLAKDIEIAFGAKIVPADGFITTAAKNKAIADVDTALQKLYAGTDNVPVNDKDSDQIAKDLRAAGYVSGDNFTSDGVAALASQYLYDGKEIKDTEALANGKHFTARNVEIGKATLDQLNVAGKAAVIDLRKAAGEKDLAAAADEVLNGRPAKKISDGNIIYGLLAKNFVKLEADGSFKWEAAATNGLKALGVKVQDGSNDGDKVDLSKEIQIDDDRATIAQETTALNHLKNLLDGKVQSISVVDRDNDSWVADFETAKLYDKGTHKFTQRGADLLTEYKINGRAVDAVTEVKDGESFTRAEPIAADQFATVSMLSPAEKQTVMSKAAVTEALYKAYALGHANADAELLTNDGNALGTKLIEAFVKAGILKDAGNNFGALDAGLKKAWDDNDTSTQKNAVKQDHNNKAWVFADANDTWTMYGLKVSDDGKLITTQALN